MLYTCNNIRKVEDYFIIEWYQQMVESDFRGANIKSVLSWWVLFMDFSYDTDKSFHISDKGQIVAYRKLVLSQMWPPVS